jgi:shikimate dehydrogenase
MRKFGLIGFPLTHSFSKKYFEAKFQREAITDASYDLFPLKTIEELPALLKSNPELIGLNITIPYKESVMQYLNKVSPEAKEVGAVNCIKWNNGNLEGMNTDCYGFEKSLIRFVGDNTNIQCYILGTGGSSKAVQFVLKKLNLDFALVSREKRMGTTLYNEISSSKKERRSLFINTTPLGMFPEINSAPEIPYDLLSENDFLFDLVYNPSETLFLKKGREKGCKTKNGLEMLELQAQKSWEIWNL